VLKPTATYDRLGAFVPEGHAKMTDEHGSVVWKRFALSDDFRDGFIDSVQVLTSDRRASPAAH
jgi:LPS-assembly protein